MSDSAEGSARKASLDVGDGSARGEGAAASLAPEEAERLAEAFIPSWQFDQATFTPGVMSQEEMERLASPSSRPVPVAPIVGIGSLGGHPQTPGEKTFGDEMTSSDVDVSGLEPKSFANTVIDPSPPMAPPPSALAPLGRPITQPMVQPAAAAHQAQRVAQLAHEHAHVRSPPPATARGSRRRCARRRG